MKDFHHLSARGQVTRLKQLALAALAHYDLGVVQLRPLLHLENTTFRAKASDGALYVLRVCRPAHLITVEELRSEGHWLAAIRRDTGLCVPEPVPTRDGDVLVEVDADHVPGARPVMIFKWVTGRFPRSKLMPENLEQVGAFMARLQLHGQRYERPAGFTRRRMDWQPLIGQWANDDLGAGEQEVSSEDKTAFRTAAEHVRAVMAQLGEGPDVFGLIHSDLHQGNYLFHKGEVRAIDFDDSGFGYYLYDMATTLWGIRSHPDFPAYRAAFFKGYDSVRPLPADAETLTETFIVARWMAVCAYLLGRTDNPALQEITPRYIGHATNVIKAWLERTA